MTETKQETQTNEFIPLKMELKLISALNKIFEEKQPEENLTTEEMTENKGYLDESLCIMFIPKTNRIKEIFKRFTNKYQKQTEIPELKYNSENTYKLDNCGKYSITFLLKIIKCFECMNESVLFYMLKDYPIKMDCEYFTFILAPRINNN